MKKAVITGERQGGVVDAPNPRPRDNWVLVKVHTVPMCTEYKAYVAGKRSEYLGHEAAGEVIDVAQPCGVRVGDRVAVMPLYGCGRCALCLSGDYIHCESKRGFSEIHGTLEGSASMAQYLLKPDWLLVALPDDTSYDHGSMACCGLGPTFGALERMAVSAYNTVLITGLGPVGLGGVINARHRGARVIGVESNPWRARQAQELGSEAVVHPTDGNPLEEIMDLTLGRGVDRAVDCSGSPTAHRLCIDAVRRRGMVAMVGEATQDTPINASRDMIRKGLALVGSWHFNLADTPKLMEYIANHGSTLDGLISHVFPLSRVREAWETQASGQCAKVLLKPWGEAD